MSLSNLTKIIDSTAEEDVLIPQIPSLIGMQNAIDVVIRSCQYGTMYLPEDVSQTHLVPIDIVKVDSSNDSFLPVCR